MNKALYTKVKDRCKDTHLSEKYLKEITENIGDVVEDDSTDEELIEKTATKIVNIAKSSQGEATRWAQNAKDNANQGKKGEGESKEDEEDPTDGDGKGKTEHNDPHAEEIKKLKEKIAEMEGKESKAKRASDIASSMEKHKIPSYLRNRLAKSIADDEDIEEAVAAIKQGLITDGLMPKDGEGEKTASEKQVDDAADSLLESLTVK